MYKGEDKDDLAKEIRENWKESKDLLSEWRKEAKECYGFVSGDQWSSEDKAVLEEEGRPCVTFNRIGAIVDVICGIEVNNRQDVHYFPRSMGDVPLNEINTAAGKWARDECYAEDEESEAFRDAVICGVGCTETKMDYDENPDGKIVIERKDPLHMTWKASARKSCLDDSPYVFNAEWMDKKEAKARWPEAEVLSSQDLWDDQTQPHNADKAYLYENDSTDQEKRKDQVLVLHYQCWKLEPYIRTLDPFDQQIKSFSEEEFEDIKEKAEMIGFIFVDREKAGVNEIPYVKQKRKVYYRAFLIGDDLLEYGKSPSQEGFTFRFITGKRDRNKNCWYGVVRPLIDPQRFGNKFFSQVLHIINSNAKGGAFVEENALKDPRKAEEQWASNRGPLIQLNEGGISKIRERQPASYPQGLDRLMTFSFESMPWVSGMNPEMLGMADKAQAGVLEEQRKRSAVTILAPLFNSLRRYRKSQGRLLLYYIREYISDGRLIRIIGENGDPRFIPLTKDASTDEYDTIVDQSPSSPDFKREVWNSVQPLLPFMMKNGYQIPDALIDLSPMPSWVASEVKKSLQGQLPPVAKQQISQMQEQVQKMSQEMQRLKEENLMLKVDSSVDLAKAQMNFQGKLASVEQKEGSSLREAQAEQIRLMLDAKESAVNERIANLNAAMEQFRAQFEIVKASQEQKSQELDHSMKMVDFVKILSEKTEKSEEKTPQAINITLETKPGKRKAKKVNGEWILEDA